MNINHYNPVRLMVRGSGNLRLRLLSAPGSSETDVDSEQLANITMSLTDKGFTDRLSNFSHVMAQLEVKITEIDETFRINQIIIGTKPTAASKPVL